MSKQRNDKNTQLTIPTGYNTKRMIFADPKKDTIPDSVPPISYQRISIGTLNPDGSTGDLILKGERLFSFGVSENVSQETKKVNGYVLPLCLWNKEKEKVTKAEKTFVDVFNAIVEKCIEHLIENKDELGLPDLERSDLKKFNPLYWKREKLANGGKGKIIDGAGPTLYAKLISSKKQGKVLTEFFDVNGVPVDAMSLLKRYCYATPAVKIESIFIGNKISLQVKLYEAEVEPLEGGMKPILPRHKATEGVVMTDTKTMNDMGNVDNDNGSDAGSVQDDPVPVKQREPSPPPQKKDRKLKKVT